MELLVASTNPKKLIELQDVLAGLPFRLKSLRDFPGVQEVEENGKTFEANAELKARGYASQTGLLTLAEDSGLSCDALEGAPGIYSSRFCGDPGNDLENNKKLLRLMAGLPDNCRRAHFVSAIAICRPDQLVGLCRGEVHGYISKDMKGANGFGYDSVFYYPPFERTFGEVEAEMKRKVSHRAVALEKARVLLVTHLMKETAGKESGGR